MDTGGAYGCGAVVVAVAVVVWLCGFMVMTVAVVVGLAVAVAGAS